MLTTSTFRARVQAFRNRQRGFVAMAAAGDVTDPAAMTSPAEVTSSSSAGAMAELIGTLAVLGAVILTTVVGNALVIAAVVLSATLGVINWTLVIAAVVLERNLRSHVANYLVAVNEGIYGPWLSDRAPVWVWGGGGETTSPTTWWRRWQSPTCSSLCWSCRLPPSTRSTYLSQHTVQHVLVRSRCRTSSAPSSS